MIVGACLVVICLFVGWKVSRAGKSIDLFLKYPSEMPPSHSNLKVVDPKTQLDTPVTVTDDGDEMAGAPFKSSKIN